MTASPSPRPDDDATRADAGDPDRDHAEAAEQSVVRIDEDAIRERADQDDADTDSLI